MIYADLIDAMVADFAALPALADVTVCDGMPLTNDPGTYLFVGIDDLDAASSDGASGVQSWPLATHTQREDAGDVLLAAYADNGEGGMKAARDAATAVLDAVQARVRANQTLGVAGVLWLSFSDYRYRALDVGAALLLFRIHFTARI